MNLTIFAIILCIAVITEAFCTVGVLLIIFHTKNENGKKPLRIDEEITSKPDIEVNEIKLPELSVPPKGSYVCWYNGNGMCANPQSKAFKKHCITTNPSLCRWSELRIQEE